VDPVWVKRGAENKEGADEVEGQADRTKLELRVKFASRDSEGEETQVETVDLIQHEPPFFQNMGVRKALLLTQFANLITALIAGEPITAQTGIPSGLSNTQKKAKSSASSSAGSKSPSSSSTSSTSSAGAPASTVRVKGVLRMTSATVTHVKTFLDYFQAEMKVINDPKLAKETEVIRTLLAQNQKLVDEESRASTDAPGTTGVDDDDL